MEVWKDVVGYERFYQISNKGNVFSKRLNRLLKLNTNQGYKTLTINVNGSCKFVKVHRLVAIAFIDNPLNKKFVNHINGNKQDNTVENLEWVTSQENNNHAYSIGLNSGLKGENGSNAKLTWDKVRKIRQLKLENSSITRTELSKLMSVHTSTIRKILANETWKE